VLCPPHALGGQTMTTQKIRKVPNAIALCGEHQPLVPGIVVAVKPVSHHVLRNERDFADRCQAQPQMPVVDPTEGGVLTEQANLVE